MAEPAAAAPKVPVAAAGAPAAQAATAAPGQPAKDTSPVSVSDAARILAQTKKLPGATGRVTRAEDRGSKPATASTASAHSAGASGSPSTAAGGKGSDSGAPAAGESSKDKTGEPAPDDGSKKDRLGKAWADLADKEASITEARSTLKTERATFEAERKAHQEQATAFNKARELVKAGDHLGALEALGIDLSKAQDQYLGNLREPTAEELARKAAREELEARDKTEADKRAEAEKKAKEEDAAKGQRARQAYEDEITAEARRLGPKFTEAFELVALNELTIDDIINRAMRIELDACKAENRAPKMPTPVECLQLVEKDLRSRVARSKSFRPAEAQVPAASAGGDKKTETTARDKKPDTTPTSEDAGSVPLRKPQVKRGHDRESALDRLKKAKQEVLGGN